MSILRVFSISDYTHQRLLEGEIISSLQEGHTTPIVLTHPKYDITITFPQPGVGEIHHCGYRTFPVNRGGKTHTRRLRNPRIHLATLTMDGDGLIATDPTGQMFREEDGKIRHINYQESVTVLRGPARGVVFLHGEVLSYSLICEVTPFGNHQSPTEVEKGMICRDYQPKVQPFPYLDRLDGISIDIREKVRDQLAQGFSQRMVVTRDGEIHHQKAFTEVENACAEIQLQAEFEKYSDVQLLGECGGWGIDDNGEDLFTYWVNPHMVLVLLAEGPNMNETAPAFCRYLSEFPKLQGRVVVTKNSSGWWCAKDGRDVTHVAREYFREGMTFTEEEMMILVLIT